MAKILLPNEGQLAGLKSHAQNEPNKYRNNPNIKNAIIYFTILLS